MNCAQIEELAPLYAGGDLSPEQTALVCEHLDFCDRCRDVAAEYEADRSWLLAAASPRFDDSIFERLREDIHREIKLSEARPHLFNALALRLGIAALGVLALIIFAVAYKRNDQPERKAPVVVKIESQPAAPMAQEASVAGAKPAPRSKRRKASGYGLPAPVRISPAPLEAIALNKAADPKAELEMTRIEFQTADPNIRIIWFTPKTGDSPITNK